MEFLTLLALLPVALILFYIYRQDHDPEPFKTLAITFLWGCVTVVPALLLEIFIPAENPFVENYCVVAPVEELVKMLVVMLYVWNHKDFDDTFDAIVYCVMASLGFAAVENLLYVLLNDDGTGLQVALLRAVLSIPGHAVFAIFMGYFVGIAKTHFYFGRKRKQWACLAAAFFSASLVHGTYDFLLTEADYMVAFLVFVLVTDICAFAMVSKASKNDHPMIQDIK
ncbi:MAG: PrsW family glutamic-type intramembrane protease [Bacteroidales bacterium]|nr:PrsW family glutamic-type intramembrane protease [Bacteroidales bacterium]